MPLVSGMCRAAARGCCASVISVLLLVTGCRADNSDTGDAPSATDPPAVAGGPRPEDSQAGPGLPSVAVPPAEVDPDGMAHSGLPASGQFATSSVDIASTSGQPNVHRYAVQVETSLPLDPTRTGRAVQEILDNPRGWVGYQGAAFHLVRSVERADLVIHLATPETVDLGCGDLDTGGVWSCQVGNDVYLNADRWFYATPSWGDASIEDYRSYVVNHEVGHYLGFGHVGCPAPGEPSPVMQQQSISLNGCLPNPWPDITGEKDY